MVFQIRKSSSWESIEIAKLFEKYCIYRTYKKDTFYDVTDALDMQNMEKIETRYREKKGVENKGTENLTFTQKHNHFSQIIMITHILMCTLNMYIVHSNHVTW